MVAIVTCILNALDALFTVYLVNKYDIDIELNPVGKWLITTKYGIIIKIFLTSLLVILLYELRKKYTLARYALMFILIIFSLLTIYHLIVFIIQEFINP